jgi:hypothetical protein
LSESFRKIREDTQLLKPVEETASLSNWFREFRKYHRDDKGSGKIVKRDDHLMDATRYLIVSGRLLMTTEPRYEPYCPPPFRGNAWMS